MPITGTGPLLGVLLAAASGSVDPPGIVAEIGVASAICSWLPANATVNPGLMVAAGAAVSGVGQLSFSAVPTFGVALAAGAGSVDPTGIARWTAVGTAITAHLAAFGLVNPSSFVVSNPITGGAVVGAGTLTATDPTIGIALAAAAGSVDGPGILAWTAWGLALFTYLTANTLILATPPGFIAPPGGGPLTGSGSLI